MDFELDSKGGTNLTLLSVFIAGFISQPPEVVIGLLLIDIASTFEVHIGLMGQIRTSAALMTVLTALLLGVLSLRFNHKFLLLTGLGFLIISAGGSYFATSFLFMLSSYAFAGIGLALIRPMVMAIIGNTLKEDDRTGAIGMFLSGNATSWVLGGPLMVIIASNYGWRSVFLTYILPITLVAFIIISAGIPKHVEQNENNTRSTQSNFFDGIRNVLTNRSALFCIVCNLLAYAAWQITLSYGISYFREIFNVSRGLASMLMSGLSLTYIVGGLLSGKVVNRFGRKNLTVLTFALLGVSSALLTNLPFLWWSVIVFIMMGTITALRSTSSNSLALEQLPLFRGPMMSLNAAAEYLGSMIGAAIGGLVLIKSSYASMGLISGGFGLIAATIVYLLVKDPLIQ